MESRARGGRAGGGGPNVGALFPEGQLAKKDAALCFLRAAILPTRDPTDVIPCSGSDSLFSAFSVCCAWAVVPQGDSVSAAIPADDGSVVAAQAHFAANCLAERDFNQVFSVSLEPSPHCARCMSFSPFLLLLPVTICFLQVLENVAGLKRSGSGLRNDVFTSVRFRDHTHDEDYLHLDTGWGILVERHPVATRHCHPKLVPPSLPRLDAHTTSSAFPCRERASCASALRRDVTRAAPA